MSKLTDEQGREIRLRHEAGESYDALAGIFNVARSTAIAAARAAGEQVVPSSPLAQFAINTKASQLADLLAEQDPIPPLIYKGVKDGKRVVIISDQQIPYHDPRIVGSPHGKVAIAEKFIREYQPDYIFINGDGIDCYLLSTFDKNPHRIFNTKDELKMAGNMIDGFRKAAPNAEIVWIDGNHEFRMWRAYMELCAKDSKVLEVLGALDIRTLDTNSLLHLPDRGVAYQPYGGHADFEGFIITHGDIVRTHSSYTARAMYDKWHSSGAGGHTHRLGCYHFTDGTGRTHAWYEIGMTCLMTLEYVSNPNWQPGFGYGEVLDRKLHFNIAPIFGGALVVPGIGVFQ